MLRREWSSNSDCFFLVWGKRFKTDWVNILGWEISPPNLQARKTSDSWRSHSWSNLITPTTPNPNLSCVPFSSWWPRPDVFAVLEMGIYLGTDMTTLKGFLWQLNRHLMSGISNQHNQRFATVRSQVGKSKSFLPYKALACFRLYFTRSLSPNIFSFLSLCFATLFSSVSFPTTTKSWWISYFCQDCRSKESDKSGSQTIHKNVCLNFYIVYLHKPNFLWNLLPPTILEIRMMYVF